ncbi:MAG: hypothetical protein ABIO70_17365 [Pseudomonadota bacterium]
MPWLLAIAAVIPAVRAGDCATPTSDKALQGRIARAEAAWVALDGVSFAAELDAALEGLGCRIAPLSPAMAAHLHRLVGLRAQQRRDEAAVLQAFAASRAIDPDFHFPTDVLPEDHPLARSYDQLPPVTGVLEAVDPPAEGRLLFDGLALDGRPRNRATIAQWVEAPGGGAHCAYLWPNDLLLPYDRGQLAVEASLPPPVPRTPVRAWVASPASTPVAPPPPTWTPPSRDVGRTARLSRRLGWTSAGSAVGAFCATAAGLSLHQRYHDPGWTPDEGQLEALRAQSMAGLAVGGGLGLTALGTGIAALAVWAW